MNSKKFLCVILSLLFLFIPIISFADDYIEDDNIDLNLEIETSNPLSDVPNINARYSVVFDRSSKTILFGKNEEEKSKMASTTKIMTAIVVLENCSNLNDVVIISKKAARNRWFKAWAIHK